MQAIDSSGATVRSVGLATAVDTPNGDGTVTRSYEQQGIEWERGPDNSAALRENARLQELIDEVEARCAAELRALGEDPG